MTYRITHQTHYTYHETVSLCHNEGRLVPRQLPNQQCLHHRIQIDPHPSSYRERQDFFGNMVCYFAIQQPHEQLIVKAESTVALIPRTTEHDLAATSPVRQLRARLQQERTADILEARPFTLCSPLVPFSEHIAAYARESLSDERPVGEGILDLMARMHRDFTFVSGFTTVTTPLIEFFQKRRGVCQDFAHLAIACLRSLGLAARYVSGYIETVAPPGKQRLTGADASHAWVSAFVPDLGWLDFDPTNNLWPDHQHIVVAWGRDYADVVPLRGVLYSSGQHDLQVAVDVESLA